MRVTSLKVRRASWKCDDSSSSTSYYVELEVMARDLIKLIDFLTEASMMNESYNDLDTEAAKEVKVLREKLRVANIEIDSLKQMIKEVD